MTFTLFDAPRTKKTHNELVPIGQGRHKILPSKAFREWNASAQMQLAAIRSKAKELPFTGPVNVKALFYRHANVGDLSGFTQALADALQEGRILVNDSQICGWDGSRKLVDKADPRVVVTIEEMEP